MVALTDSSLTLEFEELRDRFRSQMDARPRERLG